MLLARASAMLARHGRDRVRRQHRRRAAAALARAASATVRRRAAAACSATLALAGALVAPVLLGLRAAGAGRCFYDERYMLDLGILVLTYVMLGWGLNIVVGLAGLLDLGYVAFYAVGAYSYALLATNFGLSFWICLPLAGILAAFWGVLLGFPVLRLRGDYLAIVTLAFGEIIRLVLHQLAEPDRRAERHLRHSAADLLRPAASPCRATDGFAGYLRHRILADAPHRSSSTT